MFVVLNDQVGYPQFPRNCQAISTDKPFPTKDAKQVTFPNGSICEELDTGTVYKMHEGVWTIMDIDAPVLLNNATTTVTGVYTGIKMLTDNVKFTTLASNIKLNGTASVVAVADINNLSLPQGEILTGVFTSIKLQSGAVMLLP